MAGIDKVSRRQFAHEHLLRAGEVLVVIVRKAGERQVANERGRQEEAPGCGEDTPRDSLRILCRRVVITVRRPPVGSGTKHGQPVGTVCAHARPCAFDEDANALQSIDRDIGQQIIGGGHVRQNLRKASCKRILIVEWQHDEWN